MTRYFKRIGMTLVAIAMVTVIYLTILISFLIKLLLNVFGITKIDSIVKMEKVLKK